MPHTLDLTAPCHPLLLSSKGHSSVELNMICIFLFVLLRLLTISLLYRAECGCLGGST